jgi:ubiquinone/menaquinone biosynthesis C-methylase UbiE
MSTSLLERPPVSQPVVEPRVVEPQCPTIPQEQSTSWLSRMIQKSYLNSFNYCLNETGWVPQRILEIGFGDGTLLTYVAKLFMDAEVVGVEFDTNKVAQARENVCCRIQLMEMHDGETLPFDPDSFDLVISHGFLGNSPIPRHWVKEMTRVSAEGVIISAPTPMGYKWLQKLPGAGNAHLLGQPVFSSVIQPISLRQMRNWLDRIGMKTESMATPVPYGMLMARKAQSK